MSSPPTSRSPDLDRLVAEGYEVEVRNGHLIIHDIPYLDPQGNVARGLLVSTLTLTGDVTQRPSDHVVHWAGAYPHRADGTPITGIQHQNTSQELIPGIVTTHSFSNKPPEGYPDYHAKMTRYIEIISHPAAARDPAVTPRTFRVRDAESDEVFRYRDTASSRAGIAALNARMAGQRIAIIGIGGTGSYVLDLVAKTPVKEIHLFDGDEFLQHNAFRAPGAHGKPVLRSKPNKAQHFATVYDAMRTGVVAHPYHLDQTNVVELEGMSFAFICMDKGAPKRAIVAYLRAQGTPFVDVGIGLDLTDGKIGGILRITTGTSAKQDHVESRIPWGDGEDALYARNIQIPELNALNAALAVVKWRKLAGFLRDLDREHHTTFTLDGNTLTNEEHA